MKQSILFFTFSFFMLQYQQDYMHVYLHKQYLLSTCLANVRYSLFMSAVLEIHRLPYTTSVEHVSQIPIHRAYNILFECIECSAV